jgi:hypothetical protein
MHGYTDRITYNVSIRNNKSRKEQFTHTLYDYTKYGYITASNKETATENIFNLIQSYFSIYPSTVFAFLSKFYSMAKDKGLLDNILDLCLKIMKSNFKVYSVFGALEQILNMPYVFKELRHVYWDVHFEVFQSLDKRTQQMLLLRDKLNIERRIIEKSPPIEWERIWIENIHDYSKLVLYGYCEACKQEYPVVVDYFQYRKSLLSIQTNYNC